MPYWTETVKNGEVVTWGDTPSDAVEDALRTFKEKHPNKFHPVSLPEKRVLAFIIRNTIERCFIKELGRPPTDDEIFYGTKLAFMTFR